jgi:hypothetical protein
MEVLNGARSDTFPKVENATALLAVADRISAFSMGTAFDAQEFNSAIAASKALGISRGMVPDDVELALPDLLNEVMGYNKDSGTGGITPINGLYTRVPPMIEAGEFVWKFEQVPLSVLENYANGPIFQGPDLERMKTGSDLLDAGMHPTSIGGGIYKMMQDNRELRVEPGGRAWEVNLDAFVQGYTPPPRPQAQTRAAREKGVPVSAGFLTKALGLENAPR